MGGVSRERLEKAAAGLSDIVVDRGQWLRVVDDVADATGCVGASVLPYDPKGDFLLSASLREDFRRYFGEDWYLRDTRRRAIPRQMQGLIAADDDVIAEDEIGKDPYYCEFLPTTQLRWWAGLGFKAGPDMHCLGLQRTGRQGRFDRDDKAILQSLLCRMSEVATLSRAVGQAALAGVVDALGGLSIAAFSIDRSGRVVSRNAAADRLFCGDIRIRDRRIAIRDHAAASQFERLLLRIRYLREGRSLGAEALAIPRGEGAPILLKALPIDGAARNPFAGAVALFAMTEIKPPAVLDPIVVGKALGLTPAESRLAAWIATGESLESAADRLGVCKETARSQLKSIFVKTDTHRQGELVALLGTLPSDFKGPGA